MRNIFWTTVFWLGLVFLFWAYMRLFDSTLSHTMANFFASEEKVVIATGVVSTGTTLKDSVLEKLTAISTEIDIIGNKIVEIRDDADKKIQSTILNTATQTVVKLYYFNEKEDKKLPIAQQVSPESLFPITRTVPKTDNIIRDTLELLLQGALTDTEYQDGFTTEFVRVVRLADMQLSADGVLHLTFTQVPGSTMGGSAFMSILSNAIIKTASQFPQVRNVEMLPENLFQP